MWLPQQICYCNLFIATLTSPFHHHPKMFFLLLLEPPFSQCTSHHPKYFCDTLIINPFLPCFSLPATFLFYYPTYNSINHNHCSSCPHQPKYMMPPSLFCFWQVIRLSTQGGGVTKMYKHIWI